MLTHFLVAWCGVIVGFALGYIIGIGLKGPTDWKKIVEEFDKVLKQVLKDISEGRYDDAILTAHYMAESAALSRETRELLRNLKRNP